MRANSMCISCILSKQEKQIREYKDENKKSEYMHDVLEILYKYGQTESTPWIAEQINELHVKYWGSTMDYSELKKQYNDLLLEKEAGLEELIRKASDPVKECIKYVCAGNYIDFSAVGNVNEETFDLLLEKVADEDVLEDEYCRFKEDLHKAKTLVYLTDNCGEIVLDKVFIKFIKETYPELDITVVVRGADVLNDATLADAKAVGLTELVACIDNGTAAPGTVMKNLSLKARTVIENADVVISKGQGNFESLYAEGINPYYMFLCKCELFVRRFGLERFKSVFMREERLGNVEK
ncbi:MAG: DUF89 family protein [Lachnospiraceae bacterium]|nr:DUF89 family protein [Lachnospiraceae bacterium]